MNYNNPTLNLNGRKITVMGLDPTKTVSTYAESDGDVLVMYQDGSHVLARLMQIEGSIYQTDEFTVSLIAAMKLR
jgi:hypothetical protein